jgi:hypothetical protein
MKKKRQARREQIREAERIYEWLIFQRELAGDLIRKCAKTVIDKEEAANARLDLYMIVRDLAAAAAPGSRNAIWQTYQHHFVGDRNRRTFFEKLTTLTKHTASRASSGLESRKASPTADLINLSAGTRRCCPGESHGMS